MSRCTALPIEDIEGCRSIALFHIFNLMAFPDSPARQQEMLLDLQANRAFWPNGVSTDFMLSLREIPSRPQLRKNCENALQEGEKAGMILRTAASLVRAHNRPDLASLEKVRGGLSDFANNKYKGFSKRTLEDIWTRFSRVAHLWAAWIGRDYELVNFDYFESANGSHSLTFIGDLKLMALEAEDFADFGTAHRHAASNKSVSLLNGDRLFRIPGELREKWRRSLLPCPVPLLGRAERGRASVFPLDESFMIRVGRSKN